MWGNDRQCPSRTRTPSHQYAVHASLFNAACHTSPSSIVLAITFPTSALTSSYDSSRHQRKYPLRKSSSSNFVAKQLYSRGISTILAGPDRVAFPKISEMHINRDRSDLTNATTQKCPRNTGPRAQKSNFRSIRCGRSRSLVWAGVPPFHNRKKFISGSVFRTRRLRGIPVIDSIGYIGSWWHT